MTDLHVEYNTLSKADGSAVFCDDQTVFLVAVYGPVDVSTSKENYEKATVNCIFKRRIQNKQDLKLKYIENFICSSLESSIYGHYYPRTSINIIIQELQSRNNLIAPAINAAICALMDAGISQKYLIAAVCIGIKNDNKLILNPNLDDLNDCKSNLTFVINNQDFKLISFIHEGKLTIDQFESATKLAKNACQDIFTFYKESIKRKFNKTKQIDKNEEDDANLDKVENMKINDDNSIDEILID